MLRDVRYCLDSILLEALDIELAAFCYDKVKYWDVRGRAVKDWTSSDHAARD